MARLLSLLTSPWGSLVALGATWSLLSACLAADGAVARAVWVPIDPARYYAAQALFVGPWLALLGSVFAWLSGAFAGLQGGRATVRATWHALVPIWAWCTLLLFALPDLLVVLTLGREALPKAMRFYGPAAPAAIVVLGSLRLSRLQGFGRFGRARAIVIVLTALLLQTALATLLLR